MKKKISDALSLLRKHGFTVINNNYNHRFGRAMAGFVDYVIYDYSTIYFIEVKIGKDKFSEEQEITKKKLSSIAENNNGVVYLIIPDDTKAKQFVDDLVTTKVVRYGE
jgi:Holliday junction resolvase-like predicted endonuclease